MLGVQACDACIYVHVYDVDCMTSIESVYEWCTRY